MTEIKQMVESQETLSTGQPAQSPVERVIEKAKDPKEVAAGRTDAATRKVKQEKLLEQLWAAKE